jgi:ribosomal-protein-alanine N-acetyltransferase
LAKSPKSFPELTTQRLRLRQFEPRDVEGLHACFGDIEAMRYWNFPACKTKAETERWARVLARTTRPYEYLAWAVAEKRGDRCIGMVIYHHREAHNRRLEIGYMLARPYCGRGLMTEAVRALIEHFFAELGVHRVEAMIHPDNSASIKLVERLGFRRESGPLRDYWRIGESYMSAVVYALIDGGESRASSPETLDARRSRGAATAPQRPTAGALSALKRK